MRNAGVNSSLKEKLIKIGAKVVSHGRYVAFQMAEVAITLTLGPFLKLHPRTNLRCSFSTLVHAAGLLQSLNTRRALSDRKSLRPLSVSASAFRRCRHFACEIIGQLVPNITREAPTPFM
jgi:hypothetical protein